MPHISDSKPWYWKPVSPNGQRRASWHDYTSPCHYMITITRNTECRIPFSEIKTTHNETQGFIAMPLGIGCAIAKAIDQTEEQFIQVSIQHRVIMPDHVHLIMYVREPLPKPVGHIVNYLKARATFLARKEDAGFQTASIPLFQPGYHDRIVFADGILDNLRRYIADNPRRYWLRHNRPELFGSGILVASNVGEFCAYGNFLLLTHPVKSVLRVSSRHSPEERNALQREWSETARCGGVFISPLIHPHERELARRYLEEGAKVIRLTARSFGPRYHPAGEEFELCSRGQLLLLGDPRGKNGDSTMTRAVALALNDTAQRLSALGPGDWRVLKHQRPALPR